ncbi:MAG: hypothetical protein JF606_00205 [Burkholderiales bacterium]|nr:hypothetical protein [Burkholderiales bacterium]
MSTLHWTLAACLLVAMQAHAQGVPDSQPAFHADRSAIQSSTSTRREVLEAFSPVSYVALKRLEARRGAPYDDGELEAVLRSESFQREYGVGLSAFCSNPANAPNLACSPPANAPERTRMGVTP